MKDMFHNSHGYNTAHICLSSQGKDIDLFYHLNDNPVQHAWQRFWYEDKEIKTFPLSKFDITQVTNILENICASLGIRLQTPINQTVLNDLHNRFVENQGHSKLWADLNTYIHIAETVLVDKLHDYNSVITFTQEQLPEYHPLEEEHKLWLTTEESWGDLFLGYGTIGKDWLDIFRNDDDTKDLNIQSTISPETMAWFHVEFPYIKHVERDFYKWAKTKSVALNNLNKLALGRYYLGNIIISEEFLRFHPNASDWYVPNHRCKLEWNKEVLGQDSKIKSIDFFDSDMYYDSLLKHCELQGYV